MQILNFLTYWATRVYEWFGWLYAQGRSAALYAYSWASQLATNAYNAARSYAFQVVSNALNTAWNWIIEKYNAAIGFATSIRDWAAARVLDVQNLAASWVASVQNWAAARVIDVQNLAASWVSGVQNWAAARITELQNYAAALVIKAQNMAAGLVKDLRADVTRISQLVEGVNSAGTPILGTFLSNPFGFILAYVFGAFQDLLCFGLAYGLGTVNYDLPPLPDWNGGGMSGGYVPPQTIPTGTGELVAPLSNVYVSGYTFGANHKGIDLGLGTGDPVYAMHAGRVLVAEWSNVGYGFNVVLSGGDWWTRYAHLETLGVSVGQSVKAGQVIGLGNSTGNSTGPHLHLEIKYKGSFIDPLTVL